MICIIAGISLLKYLQSTQICFRIDLEIVGSLDSTRRADGRANVPGTASICCRRYLPAADPTWHDITWHDMTWARALWPRTRSATVGMSSVRVQSVSVQCYCGEEANRVRRDSRSRAIDRSLQNIVLTLKYIISRESNVRYELYAISIFWYVFTNICFCFKTLLLDITISSNFGQFCRTFHSCRNGIHVDNDFFI